ncbi:GNAT family N-acetyltransferase [Rhabdothermincola salaria]|uniref:GNAT family N-acetyltransferase n=1 Tax=Rhabdothermincola salaria TaxID=2903142 RepID=UPI001E290A56|nr:GNAT family N-acetyltransferase [Rhabdothermincola salaria]
MSGPDAPHTAAPSSGTGGASSAPSAPSALEGGLVLRAARSEDRDGVIALNEAAFGVQDASAVASVFEPGSSVEWLVVADEGPGASSTVVGACCRIPHRFRLDGATIPGSQIEFVVTDPSVRGRGLVRALFARHHARAAELGEQLQVIGGIPYYYRKLGYGYAIDYPPLVVVEPTTLLAPDPSVLTIRPARTDDIAALVALDVRRDDHGLVVERDDDVWRRWLSRTSTSAAPDAPGLGLGEPEVWEALVVAERAGTIVGWLRVQVYVDEAQVHLLPGPVPDADVGLQLLARVRQAADHLAGAVLGRPVEILTADRPGSAWARVLAVTGHPRDEPSGIYGRTPDELGLLRTLEPVLSRRLATSHLAGDRGEVVISLYERAIRLAWSDGRVTTLESCPADPDPFDSGQVGVAPDWFPALVLGRWGASGLAARVDDVQLGHHTAVMDVLFPPRPNDLVADL